jgi:hypothetical protein
VVPRILHGSISVASLLSSDDVDRFLELASRGGFSPVLYAELYCSNCGGFRAALTHSDEMMPCPKCRILRPSAIVARGFAKQVTGVWERWEWPLQPRARAWVVSQVDEAAQSLRERRKLRRGTWRNPGNAKPKLRAIIAEDFSETSRYGRNRANEL